MTQLVGPILVTMMAALLLFGPLAGAMCIELIGKRAARKRSESASVTEDERPVCISAESGTRRAPRASPRAEPWLVRLKAAYDAGYYRTEVDQDRQMGFPWQNKTCQHCPAWRDGYCRVYHTFRRGAGHTCRTFDVISRTVGAAPQQSRIPDDMRLTR